MLVSYFDHTGLTDKKLITARKKLDTYRMTIRQSEAANDLSVPESSLYYAKDFALHESIAEAKKKFKKINHLILIGIGGSSLGLEAIHLALGEKEVRLTVIDTVAPYKIGAVLEELMKLKNLSKVGFCVISKSGTTTETLANTSVLMTALKTKFGAQMITQTIFIGDAATPLEAYAKKQKASFYAIPKPIGGRFCMATAAGLIPMALLGHDVDEFIDGYVAAASDDYEQLVTESAVRLSLYRTQLKYNHYNFFAFDTRLSGLAFWYRQLFAESLGKEKARNGKILTTAMVPAVSTSVELHSTGQHYMSGVSAVYTDFVALEDDEIDFKVGKGTLAPHLASKTLGDIATALYGGVTGAYRERQLPYRTTIFDGSLTYSLGLFMAMRIKEILYVAELEDINAFDQPNVELYKDKMRALLVI